MATLRDARENAEGRGNLMTDDDELTSEDPLASNHVKISRSNLGNAKKTYKEIKTDDKRLGSDLKKQDFSDAMFQSVRLQDASGREAQETRNLKNSQSVKAQEVYSKTKKKIASREYNDTKKKISHESKTSKMQIKGTQKLIRHNNKERKRDTKLKRLQDRARSGGESSGTRRRLLHRRRN